MQRTPDKLRLGPLFRLGRAREDLVACVLLGAIVLVLFGHAALAGLVLAPTDNIFLTPFFAPEAPPDFAHPGNPLLLDQVYQFVPWRRFSWEALRQGRLPLWNPYSHAGAPFVATMSSAVFYPINVLLALLPFEQTFAWSAFLKLWTAGVLTYLLARRYGLSWPASGVSAVAFMLSGFMVVWLGHPHTNVAVWFPGLMLLGELLVTARNRAERLRYSALLALVIGVQFTGGHFETSGDILIAFALYYLLRWVQVVLPAPEPRRVKLSKLLLLPIGAGVLGAGLASIQLLPFLEWLPLSTEFHARLSKAGFQLLNLGFWRSFFYLPLLVFPNLYNNPTWSSPPYRSFLPWGQNFNEEVLYVGVLPLIFAIMALLVRRDHVPHVRVWTVIGLIALGRALHLPVFDWLNQLPLLNVANPHRLRLVFAFSISVLAGFGAQAWWGTCPPLRDRATRHWQRLCAAVVGLGLLLGIGGNFVLPLLKGALTAAARHRAEMEFVSRGAAARPLGYYYELADQAVEKILRAFSVDNLSMYLPALIAVAALGITLWALRQPARRWHVLPVLQGNRIKFVTEF
jgi:hypothetical protein